jgi:hypothetical protein
MKTMRKLFSCALVLSALLLTGCDYFAPKIVDWNPVHVFIEAVDTEGNSILSPDMPEMTLTFQGETFHVTEGYYPVPATKMYLPTMYGLVAQPMNELNGKTVYRLAFGEIDGAADMDEDIVLHWPDGSEDVIHYHCSNHREWPQPSCKRTWKLNGKKHDGGTFRFEGKMLPE